jgi:hypothetical protein
MAEHLIGYARGQREDNKGPEENGMREGPPSAISQGLHEVTMSSADEPSLERSQHESSRFDAREPGEQNDNIGSQLISNSETVTSGQVCR